MINELNYLVKLLQSKRLYKTAKQLIQTINTITKEQRISNQQQIFISQCRFLINIT